MSRMNDIEFRSHILNGQFVQNVTVEGLMNSVRTELPTWDECHLVRLTILCMKLPWPTHVWRPDSLWTLVLIYNRSVSSLCVQYSVFWNTIHSVTWQFIVLPVNRATQLFISQQSVSSLSVEIRFPATLTKAVAGALTFVFSLSYTYFPCLWSPKLEWEDQRSSQYLMRRKIFKEKLSITHIFLTVIYRIGVTWTEKFMLCHKTNSLHVNSLSCSFVLTK